jgi:hypothetical protein
LFLCLDYSGFCLLSFLYNTHNTNNHAHNGIRTSIPSRQEATDLRPRPRGHRNRRGFKPAISAVKRLQTYLHRTATAIIQFTIHNSTLTLLVLARNLNPKP